MADSPRPVTPDEVPAGKAWEEFLVTQTGGVRDPYAIRFDVLDVEQAFHAGFEAGKEADRGRS